VPDATNPVTLDDQELAEELTEAEKEDVHKRVPPRAVVVLETIRAEGELELHRPTAALALSGLAAGLSMGFSLVAMGAIRAALPDAPWRELVVKLGYCVGFLIIVIGRQQLFTENTLTPVIPLLHNRDVATFKRVCRLWGVVLVANLVGAFCFSLVVGRTHVFPVELRDQFAALAQQALAGSFGDQFLRAIFSGWLIALMVWLLPNADTSRVFVVVLLTYMIGIGQLSHIVAGSVEAFYAVVTGGAAFGHVVIGFIVPVLLGNLLGGGMLVGALHHAQIEADKAHT
jgi:formate/nitrite transporter FocA (FNT family)